MSVSLGDAWLYLKADDSQLNKTLASSEQKTQGWGSKVGGFLTNSLSFAVGGILQTGISAITSSIGGLASEMISSNAAFEDYETRFKTLLGSTEEAQGRMADLAEFGAKTPFELPGVVEADLVLQSFGLHSDEAAKKFGFAGEEIRTIAGDVASGTGADFKEMSLLIGKFSAGATGEAISRMQELGITNREELAKMGLEFSKSGELLSPLPESMNVVLGLMKEKYGGLMEAQSQTFNGMVSNLQDWMGNLTRTLGKPIFDVFKERLGGLLTILNAPEVQAAIESFAGFLADGLGQAMDFINSSVFPTLSYLAQWFMGDGLSSLQAYTQPLIDYLIPALQELGGRILNEVIPAIVAFVTPIIEQVIPGIQLLGEILFNLATIYLAMLIQWWNFLIDNINIVIPILAAVGAAILAITAPITLVIGAIVLLATAWANNWGGIQEKTQAVLDFIMPFIQTAMAFISGVITSVLTYLQKFWQEHSDAIMVIINFLWTTIVATVDKNIKFVQFVIETVAAIILAFWEEWGDELLLLATTAWTNIKVFIQAAMDLIGFIIEAAAALIKGDWEAFGEALKNIWQTTWDAIKAIVSNLGNTMATIIQNNVITPIQTKWTTFTTTIETLWETLWDEMLNVVENSLDPFQSAIDSIMGWVNDAIDGLLEMIGLQQDAQDTEGQNPPGGPTNLSGNLSGASAPGGLHTGNTRNITFIQNNYGGTTNAASDLGFLSTIPVT